MEVIAWNPARDGELTRDNLANKLEQLGYRTTCYTYPRESSLFYQVVA